jgi:hypothetical protein
VVGNPMEALLNLIVAEGVDVVVMGPKGRTDLEHVLVGISGGESISPFAGDLISYRDETISKRLHKRFHQTLAGAKTTVLSDPQR